MTVQFLSFPCVVLLAVLIVASADPQNGDIRLADGTSVSGRLEVYNSSLQTWGTVCYNPDLYPVWEKGAARAACRQLEYMDMKDVNTVKALGIPEAPSSTPILLYNLNCEYNTVTDLNNEFEHILRCTYEETGNCTHAQDMAIKCESSSKYDSPYGSEVRLAAGGTGYPSSGVVEVYLNNRWGPVCTDDYADADFANAVCRQMGYTKHTGLSTINVTTYGTEPALQHVICVGGEQCLSACFTYPSATEITCTTGQIATVNCSFKESQRTKHPGGDETLCAVYPLPPPPGIKLAEIIGGVIGGVMVVTIVILIVLLCCCFISGCPLHTWRDRKLHGYRTLN